MSVEREVYQALRALVSNRVYRDLAPDTVSELPRITFQQVGGDALNFVDPTAPSKKNARIQVNVWHTSRDDAMALMRDVEDALRVVPSLHTTVLGAAVAIFEQETKLYGARQDFSFWYDD